MAAKKSYLQGVVDGLLHGYLYNYLVNVGHDVFHHIRAMDPYKIAANIKDQRPGWAAVEQENRVILPFMVIRHGLKRDEDDDMITLDQRIEVVKEVGGKRRDASTEVVVIRVEDKLYYMAYEWAMPTLTVGKMIDSGKYSNLDADMEKEIIDMIRDGVDAGLRSMKGRYGDRTWDIMQVGSFEELKQLAIKW